MVPTADRQRATVQVKVSIVDHDPRILPEMGARVDFLAQPTRREADAPRRAAPAAAAVPAPGRGRARERAAGASYGWCATGGSRRARWRRGR